MIFLTKNRPLTFEYEANLPHQLLIPMLCTTGQKITHASTVQMYQKITHAINTPLNGIIGCLELLNTFGDTFSGNDIKDLAESSLSASKNLHKLLENLLMHTHLSSPDHLTHFQSCRNFRTKSDEIKQYILDQANELGRLNNLNLVIEDGHSLNIPKNHLFKILAELLENACQYSLNGSHISVTGSLDESRSYYQIIISDLGVGMSPEQIKSIGPFVQFYKSQNGIGLGLHLAKTLTQLYQGLLQVKSKLKQGTKVYVNLPISTI